MLKRFVLRCLQTIFPFSAPQSSTNADSMPEWSSTFLQAPTTHPSTSTSSQPSHSATPQPAHASNPPATNPGAIHAFCRTPAVRHPPESSSHPTAAPARPSPQQDNPYPSPGSSLPSRSHTTSSHLVSSSSPLCPPTARRNDLSISLPSESQPNPTFPTSLSRPNRVQSHLLTSMDHPYPCLTSSQTSHLYPNSVFPTPSSVPCHAPSVRHIASSNPLLIESRSTPISTSSLSHPLPSTCFLIPPPSTSLSPANHQPNDSYPSPPLSTKRNPYPSQSLNPSSSLTPFCPPSVRRNSSVTHSTPNSHPSTSRPPPPHLNIHPMHTRSKNNIHKPITKLNLVSITTSPETEPTTVTQDHIKPF